VEWWRRGEEEGAKAAGGDDDPGNVDGQSGGHEWGAEAGKEYRGTGGSQYRQQIGNVMRAAGDHARSAGACAQPRRATGLAIEPSATSKLDHNCDLGSEAGAEEQDPRPILDELVDEVTGTCEEREDENVEGHEAESGRYPRPPRSLLEGGKSCARLPHG
jgi:hypothetical protein